MCHAYGGGALCWALCWGGCRRTGDSLERILADIDIFALYSINQSFPPGQALEDKTECHSRVPSLPSAFFAIVFD